MKISKIKLRRIILKDSLKILNESDNKRKSEMKQFVESRGGRKMEGAGRKISSAASVISELAGEQTGTMRETLYGISEFVEKVGTPEVLKRCFSDPDPKVVSAALGGAGLFGTGPGGPIPPSP